MEDVHAIFLVGNLAGGFEVPELGLAVLTDHEIFERMRRRRAGRRFSRGISLKELLAMRPGDFVVHIDHGVGVYRGIERLPVDGQLTDCMKLEYAGGDKLFIPVDQLNLVQKYSAEEGHRPALSRLGTGQWAKTKARVKQSIKEMAGELMKLYALRKTRPGHGFSRDAIWQTEMEARFPYEETPDQLKAIQDVKGDMEQAVPMDRLVCGDVGYGKTEVAIRAAFKCVMDGKQVALLVPTTLLAQQHFDTVSERLKGYPVRIDMLSRFRTAKEARAVLAALAAGQIDLVIGTHRLLSKDVKFKDAGLIIVDEEHRFGVRHKERLKHMRTQVDVLTLTATPIPRTLNLALMGARDMSTIRTPPRDRRPIQTEITEFNDELIAYALMREADRGGQSFFVHNRVESIDAIGNYLRGLVPHLRIAVAHGQMRERQLEDVMRKFLEREFDVLVATMIIESGLDMPNVNTIVVNRTDTFGLAQLYQLRGRVGRSARKAYAYLLVPPARVITEQAMKRLKAIEEFEDLGSGFQLAMRDLEIRGAGNLLGTEQHGFILNIGFDLYTRLMEDAIRELRGEAVPDEIRTRLVTDMEAFLPDDYVVDAAEKMNLYKRLADADTPEAVDELAGEVGDRFGRLPPAAANLFELRRLRIRGAAAGVEVLTLRDGGLHLDMARPLKRADVQRLIAQMPVPVMFKTHGRHRVEVAREEVRGEPLLVAAQLLDCLSEDAPAPGPKSRGRGHAELGN
jgi:transcription-repair coupling factor (superfamily II helicase)